MKKTKSLLFHFLIVLLAIGCKKIELPNSSLEKLFGSWELTTSTGGITENDILNLENDKYEIEFKENGVFKSYLNGKKSEKLKYSINSLSENSSEYIIEFDDAYQCPKLINFQDEKTLTLSDYGCSDGYINSYRKK